MSNEKKSSTALPLDKRRRPAYGLAATRPGACNFVATLYE
jgi:hypothetical protein